MKTMRRISPAMVAMVMMLLAPLASAQVMQQVPSDALIVIKFNKLKSVSDKAGALATKFGLAEWQPDFANPLAWFKKEGKIQNGLDDAGDAAVVITKFAEDGKGKKGDEEMFILLPVTDYKAFLANFADAKQDGEFSVIKFGTNQDDSFVAQRGKYAAIGTSKDVLAKKPDGLTVQGLSAKEMDTKDIVVYGNMKVARAQILPKIAEGRAKFLKDFEKGYQRGMAGGAQPQRPAGASGGRPQPPATANAAANANAQKLMPVVRAFLNRLIDSAEEFVKDADAATYGITLDDGGIGTTAMVEFNPQSYAGQQVAQWKNTEDSLVKGLPASTYLLFGGSVIDTKAMQKLISDFTAPIEKEVAAVGPEAQPVGNYIQALKKMVGATTGQAWGWVQPKGALGQEAIFQIVSINKGDAQTLVQSQQDMLNSQQAFMDLFTPPAARASVKVNFTPNAKTIDGVTLNQFVTQFTPPQGRQTPQQMQMQQMMAWMYGPGGMNGYVGAIGNDKMIGGVGVNDEVLKQLVAAAKADDDSLSKNSAVMSVKSKLPKQRMAEMYFAVDQFAVTVANYAKMFGMPVNFQMPQNLPPVGLTIATEGSAVRGDCYIPAKLVQSLVAGVQQTMMQMQGGAQPGGPGGI
jgi:hypothetical protein